MPMSDHKETATAPWATAEKHTFKLKKPMQNNRIISIPPKDVSFFQF